MKACIFIDGENFRHSLLALFPELRKSYLPKNANWSELLAYLADQAYDSQLLRTYWYTVEQILFSPGRFSNSAELRKTIKDFGPKKFQELLRMPDADSKLEWILEIFAKDKSQMEKRFKFWKEFENGMAKRVDSLEFRRAGSIRYSLYDGEFGTEKAVDVKLAVDLLQLKKIYEVAIIVSGDQDYVPAVQAIKDAGKKVVNVVFINRKGDLLPGGAKALNLHCDKAVTVKYQDMQKFMHMPPGKYQT